MPKPVSDKSSAGICSHPECISDRRRTVLRIFLAAFAVLILFSLAAAPVSAGIAPVTISSVSDLVQFRNNLTAGEYSGVVTDVLLTANLDLSSVCGEGKGSWTPIGDSTYPFKGTFDGDNYTISNLHISSGSYSYTGLFGYTDGATIKNLGVINVDVGGMSNVGGLVGCNDGGRIENCYATGVVKGTGSSIGGLVGWNNGGTITNCYATGAVTGTGTNVGGLVGVSSGAITNCYATGAVTSNDNFVGGLVGYNNAGTIRNCYATGAVDGGTNVGGLVGVSSGAITNCYATGAVEGWNNVGGLVGLNYAEDSGTASITNCYATGTVTGDDMVGGLVGWNYVHSYNPDSPEGTANIINCYATGEVSGSDDVGGLVGLNEGTITYCHAEGRVTGNSGIGGLVGINWRTIEYSYATGAVAGIGVSVGGLAGSNFAYSGIASIKYCYATGTVTGDESVGGLVGDIMTFFEGTASIENSYAIGAVTGNNQVGGLVGLNLAGMNNYPELGTTIITNCYAIGAVTGSECVGGLVGANAAENSGTNTITYSYATGIVTGSGDYVGGLVGGNGVRSNGVAKIKNSVALNPYVSAVGKTNVSRVVGYNEDGTISDNYAWNGMKVNGNFVTDGTKNNVKGEDAESADVWDNIVAYRNLIPDFDTNWKLSINVNYKLPILKWQDDNSAADFNAVYLKPVKTIDSNGGSTDTGSGNYKIYERFSTDGGHISFGTSPYITGVELPKGSNGKVVLTIISEKDWIKDITSEYLFDIEVINMADGTAKINFKLSKDKLDKLGIDYTDVCLYHEVDGVWVKLKTEFTVGEDGYIYYTSYTDSFSPFKIVFEENGATEVSQPEVTAVKTQTPEPEQTYVEPAYVEPTMPATVPTPEQTKSPVGLVGLGLGLLGAAVVLRRK